MTRILGTIFKGSATQHEVVSAVLVSPNVILAHLEGSLTMVREGQPPQIQNRQTLVLILLRAKFGASVPFRTRA